MAVKPTTLDQILGARVTPIDSPTVSGVESPKDDGSMNKKFADALGEGINTPPGTTVIPIDSSLSGLPTKQQTGARNEVERERVTAAQNVATEKDNAQKYKDSQLKGVVDMLKAPTADAGKIDQKKWENYLGRLTEQWKNEKYQESESLRRNKAVIASIGDALSALGNMAYSHKGTVKDGYPVENMTDKMRERWDKFDTLRREREKEMRAYELKLRAMKADEDYKSLLYGLKKEKNDAEISTGQQRADAYSAAQGSVVARNNAYTGRINTLLPGEVQHQEDVHGKTVADTNLAKARTESEGIRRQQILASIAKLKSDMVNNTRRTNVYVANGGKSGKGSNEDEVFDEFFDLAEQDPDLYDSYMVGNGYYDAGGIDSKGNETLPHYKIPTKQGARQFIKKFRQKHSGKPTGKPKPKSKGTMYK